MESKDKELVVEILERMPADLIREVHHYAEYLEARSQNKEWTQLSLAGLAARYAAEEVEYSLDDLKR
jgi:hypothetical protein